MKVTDNYKKHTAQNPLQKYFINVFFASLIKEAAKLEIVNILDAGCGEGFTLEKLKSANIGRIYAGIDYSENAIKLGHSLHPEFDLRTGDIYNMPFRNGSFDLVVCTEVLEHLENPSQALLELSRVSRKYCIISVPHEPWFMIANFMRGKNWSRMGNDIEHIHHWSSNAIRKLVSEYFDILEVKNPFPWTLIVAKVNKQ